MWRRHLPDQLAAPALCASCRLPMPCRCWRFADAFLAEALAPVEPAASVRSMPDEVTRELPRVAPPVLPRRRPGAHLDPVERYDGWFTR